MEKNGRWSTPYFKVGKILKISGHPLSGLAQLYIGCDGGFSTEVVHIESGFGLRQVANAFGSLKDAIGKEIRYSVDGFGVLEGFTPVEEVD